MTESLDAPGLLATARDADAPRGGRRAPAPRRTDAAIGAPPISTTAGGSPAADPSTAIHSAQGGGSPTTAGLHAGQSGATSFEGVFASEYPAVARMAYLLLGRTGEAEEAAQEAFTTLLQRWDRIDNPAGFVRTATLNRCRDIGLAVELTDSTDP